MDLLARAPMAALPEPVERDARRVITIWRDCRSRHGGNGPFLFSGFSIADAMFAPVAARFRTYVPGLAPYGDDGTAAAYVSTIFTMPAMAAWEAGARAEQPAW